MTFKEFRFPTILGLSVILLGIIAGVFLIMKDKIFITKASPDLTAQNIFVTNITEDSVTISWHTQAPTTGFIKYGQNSPDEQTILDDKDTKAPKPHLVHYVTLKNLLPKTTYQYVIVSSKLDSKPSSFTTASPTNTQNGFRPVVGTIFDNKESLKEGIVYLSIDGASNQSALIKNNGNYLIPFTFIRTSSLNEVFNPSENTKAKITVISPKGEATALFTIKEGDQTLQALNIGQNIDFTNNSNPSDLNKDGQVNSADRSVIFKNLGKNPKDKGADVNNDGIVDEKDLAILSQHLNQ